MAIGHQQPQIVYINTIDGVKLEGLLYTTAEIAPVIIMTHGMNCVKEMSLAETAEGFHRAGYNVLLYDVRSVGGSGGSPRNQINPYQNAEDVSDVVSYVSGLPSVSASQIMLWGMSFGGAISGCAAAIDRRVCALIMVCPIFKFIRADKRATGFARLMRDRESQLLGNAPSIIQPFNSRGENPIGFAGSGGRGGKEAYNVMKLAALKGHPNFRDRITVQSYHKMALFRPKDVMEEHLEDTPTLMIIPELDDISLPQDQKAVYDVLKTPKQLYVAKNMGHMSILDGEGSEEVRRTMVQFYANVLRREGC